MDLIVAHIKKIIIKIATLELSANPSWAGCLREHETDL